MSPIIIIPTIALPLCLVDDEVKLIILVDEMEDDAYVVKGGETVCIQSKYVVTLV